MPSVSGATDLGPGPVVGVYRPAALDGSGRRVCDWDEDSVTLAVEAARLVAPTPVGVRTVTVVSRSYTYVVDDAPTVIAAALRLGDDVPVHLVQGGGAAVLLAVASAAGGDVVVGVDTDGSVGATAVRLGAAGRPTVAARYRHSVPQRVRRSGSQHDVIYDDARLMRERGWRPAIEALAREGTPLVTGVPGSVSSRVGGAAPTGFEDAADSTWAAIVALAEAWARPGVSRVIALDGASGIGVDVPAADVRVRRVDREPYPAVERLPGARIAISLPAYERAFDAKVGLKASRCTCGLVTFPPRRVCAGCGSVDGATSLELSHDATVYSVATVRTPLPGLPPAYSLAVVDVAGADVRALVHVTAAPAGSAAIDQSGRLVLRKVAEREGIPDYGYAFAGEPT